MAAYYSLPSALPVADVHEMAGDRRRRGHGRADQVRASALALAALEVAVAGAGAALAGRQAILVHGQAHRAPRLAPLEAGLLEDAIQPLALGLPLDQARAGDDHGLHGGSDLAPFHHAGGGAQILDA